MLWYKAWLETRTRFLVAVAGITGLCSYVVYELGQDVTPRSTVDHYYSTLHSGHRLIAIMWLVAMSLLMMGGLVQEKAAGVSSFTLALPVSRARLMGVRIWAGLTQAAALAVLPWIVISAVFSVAGWPISLFQVRFYLLLLAGGGIVFAGVAVLISSLVDGQYTAPMLVLGVLLFCANAPRSLNSVNPLVFMSGRDYMARPDMLAGPIPWARLAANVGAAALFMFGSVKVVQNRDF